MDTKKYIVFYSWQSDIPQDINLKPIRRALKLASADLEEKLDNIQIDQDEATRNTSGSINIPKSIFQKISRADIFVCDITTINKDSQESRKAPNPNVLIELGYAIANLGWKRIIMLFNKEYGVFPNDVPFDIDRHRIADFIIKNKNDKKGKDDLKNILKNAVEQIIKINPPKPSDSMTLDPEIIKKRNDIKQIKLVLSSLHIPSIDHFISQFPDYIQDDIFHYWESFNAIVSSSLFFIYDELVSELINKFHSIWRICLSFDHRYRSSTKADFFIFDSTLDVFTAEQEKDYNYLKGEKIKLAKVFYEILNLIRKNYLEIDLEATSNAAFSERSDFIREFSKNIKNV
jgi:hypothetical protein